MLHFSTENQMDSKREALKSIDECLELYAESFKDLSLDDGKLGLAIYYYYQHKFSGKIEFLTKARNVVEICVESLESSILEYSNKYLTDSLSNYLSGFGKTLLFIENHLDPYYNFSEIHLSIQELLIELNVQNFENKDWDITSGALACGNYFINHYQYMNDDVCKKHLLDIVYEIDQNKLSDDHGKTVYWNSPSLNNKVYIGLSHGSAMIINFLTKLFNLKILERNNTFCVELLDKAVHFVLNQKRNYDTGYFPTFYPNHEGLLTTQFTICYGDFGVAYSLHEASYVLSLPKTTKTALEILKSCAKRPLDKMYTFDAGITYGATGLFTAFQKIYKKYNISEFEIASNYWADKILEFRDVNKKGYAGFINRFNKNTDDIPFNLSFGWGLIGISIGLMKSIDDRLPAIDELTLVGI